jgi:hypothetical protein
MLQLFILALLTAPPAGTDVTETLLRAAAYDRNLEARTPEGFRLGVVFDPDSPKSKAEAERFAVEANAVKASESEFAPEWVELVAVDNAAQLYKWTRTHHVSALYIPAGMETHVPMIVTVSEAAGVFTLAGSHTDVERGLVIGLRVSDGAKKLVANMAAAERAGVDFDAVVRQIAQRVGDAPAKENRGELGQTLARYSEAIRDRDLDALRDVWPTLKGDDEKRIVSSFKMTRSHTVFFAVLRIENRGDTARARVRRADKIVTRDGQTVTAGTLLEISFFKVGGGWQIDSMAKANPLS